MIDFEIPLGKRTKLYRFFEMVPAILSYGAFIVLIILSLVSPLLAAIYLMVVIIALLVRAVAVIYHTLSGHRRLVLAQRVHWSERLSELENPAEMYEKRKTTRPEGYGMFQHVENLRLMSADPTAFPKPSELYNLVIVPAYNEAYEVIEPTIESLVNTT